MDLNALADFTLVASHGGFGKASRASGRSKATLSRRIADLEEQLGVRLIERGTRGLTLTEAGQLLLARAEAPLHEVADAVAAAREGQAVPRGTLRVAAPVLFAQLALGRICADFRAAYPEVRVEVVAEDRLVDLVEEGFDVAIRLNPRPDSALVGRCFATDRLVVVAAPSVPKPTPHGDAPVSVDVVVMSRRDELDWVLDGGRLKLVPVPVLRLSSLLTIRAAVLAGAGAARLPISIAGGHLQRGELVQWGDVGGEDVSLWVLHTSRRLPSPKVRAFVDFMGTRYPDGKLVMPD